MYPSLEVETVVLNIEKYLKENYPDISYSSHLKEISIIRHSFRYYLRSKFNMTYREIADRESLYFRVKTVGHDSILNSIKQVNVFFDEYLFIYKNIFKLVDTTVKKVRVFTVINKSLKRELHELREENKKLKKYESLIKEVQNTISGNEPRKRRTKVKKQRQTKTFPKWKS